MFRGMSGRRRNSDESSIVFLPTPLVGCGCRSGGLGREIFLQGPAADEIADDEATGSAFSVFMADNGHAMRFQASPPS